MNMFESYSVGLIWHLITSNNLCFFIFSETHDDVERVKKHTETRVCDVDLKEQVWKGVVYVTIQQLKLFPNYNE